MEAARHLAKFAALVEQHHLKHQIMAIFKYLKQDVEDSDRAVVVWCCSALWKLLETQDAVANILPFIVNSQQDESPQVRQMVAQQIIELYKAVGSDVPRQNWSLHMFDYYMMMRFKSAQLRLELSSLFPSEILYIKMKIALFKLERGDQKDCKNLLEEGQTTLDSMTDIDPSLYGSYYWVSSQYHKARQEFAEFYRCALLYLAYTSVESLSQSFKLDLAIDLSLSAMLGDEIYNFGELLTHPIVESLIGTKDEWLYHILEAFKSGDLIGYQELCAAHQAAFTAQPALLQNKTKLLEKINIMCLMEIIFSRTVEDRTIPLSVIAERTKLSVEDVEYLLMKSLSVHLIEGTIDQVEGTVHVSWVRPRVLEIPQIKSLRDIG